MGFEPTTPCGAPDFESGRWPVRLPSSRPNAAGSGSRQTENSDPRIQDSHADTHTAAFGRINLIYRPGRNVATAPRLPRPTGQLAFSGSGRASPKGAPAASYRSPAKSHRTLGPCSTYNSNMRTVFFQVAMLASAATVALPPGWCRGLMGECQAAQQRAAANCCQHDGAQNKAQHGAGNSENAPASPGARCCCTRQALPQPEAVQPPDDLGVSHFALTGNSDAAACPRNVAGNSLGADLHAGPPLRILQCVWRC